MRFFFGNPGRAICAATALRATLMFAIHTPRARAAFGASFQLEVGDVAPYTCIFAELGTVLAEGAHVHVALEELHEPSLPQHREGVLDE